jgi:hypothetical protein
MGVRGRSGAKPRLDPVTRAMLLKDYQQYRNNMPKVLAHRYGITVNTMNRYIREALG